MGKTSCRQWYTDLVPRFLNSREERGGTQLAQYWTAIWALMRTLNGLTT